MKISIESIPILVLKYILIIWLLGLLPVAFELIFFVTSFLIVYKLVNNKVDTLVLILIFLLFLQIIPFLLSFRFDFFTLSRGLASFRNIANFTLIISAYILCQTDFKKFITQNAKKIFFTFIYSSIFAFILGFFYKRDIILDSLFSMIVDVSWFKVNIVRMGWLGSFSYPRSIVFSTYPNGTAIIVFCSFIIFRRLNFEKFNLKFNFYYLLFILGVFVTGSRIVLLAAGFLYFLEIYEKRKKIFKIFFYLLIFISVLFFNQIYDFIYYLFYLRLGSTNTRLSLYFDSIDFVIKNSPIIGLGIKPKLASIIGGQLPLGSHSSLLGYFVKCGFIGFFFFAPFFFFYIFRPFVYLIKLRINKITISKSRLFILVSTSLLFIIYLFEDFDASEVVCFLTGIILYINKKNEE